MKKTLTITALIFTGSLILFSCSNAVENKSEMKTPLESNKTAQPADVPGSTNTGITAGTDTRLKTIENLQAAFKGETTASAKYAAFSRKAEEEGKHEIALLFKAASMAENIHANNHKAVLQETGAAIPVIKPEFVIMSTRENLEDAIKGETYEASTMYPEFLRTANEADDQMAMISFNYAYKTEKKHKVLYENALAAIKNNTEKSLASVFYICPTCGNTYEKTAPARCGISMTGGEKFIKIISI